MHDFFALCQFSNIRLLFWFVTIFEEWVRQMSCSQYEMSRSSVQCLVHNVHFVQICCSDTPFLRKNNFTPLIFLGYPNLATWRCMQNWTRKRILVCSKTFCSQTSEHLRRRKEVSDRHKILHVFFYHFSRLLGLYRLYTFLYHSTLMM